MMKRLKCIRVLAMGICLGGSLVGCVSEESNRAVILQNSCDKPLEVVLVFGVRPGPSLTGVIRGEGGIYLLMPPDGKARLNPSDTNLPLSDLFSGHILMLKDDGSEWTSFIISHPSRQLHPDALIHATITCNENRFSLGATDGGDRVLEVRLISKSDGDVWNAVESWRERLER